MWRLGMLVLVLGLAGCGAEVAGTAATVGTLKAKEAQEAQKQQELVKQRLDVAVDLERQRLQKAAADGQ